ncbi:MAG: hypothetical protein JW787_18595 [Sedimentisphaerales bacterium]|nr:hypothetical protein [Sedimentisphaerales bacterium]
MERKINRRQFLRTSAGITAIGAIGCAEMITANHTDSRQVTNPVRYEERKLIIILFGGGTRSSESIDDPEHRYILRLWNDMVPKGTLFTNMRVEHKVVHPNSAGSIMTGHWEWDDIEWTNPVAHPTIFEIYRKARHTPDTAAWAFVYASILAKTGESSASDYGLKYAANVIEPPTIPRSAAEEIDKKLREAANSGSTKEEIKTAEKCAEIARSTSQIQLNGLRSEKARDFLNSRYSQWKQDKSTTSHDVFLADAAISCMHTFAPDVLAVDFGEIDCAHYGSWSRYVEAIHRTDELTWRVWQAVEQIEQYKGKTLLLVLPDHGRELDHKDQLGFIHHSNFYNNEGADEGCRRVWMLALGAGVKSGLQIDKPVPITTAAATGLEYLGLNKSSGAEKSVLNLIT